MIFLTVGSQMPFDRLVKAVDEWAAQPGSPAVFAQIGNSDYVPRNMDWVASLSPSDYLAKCRQAAAMVAHAGMGSIITAAEYQKLLFVVPRRGSLGETRNDHQVDTARWLAKEGRVIVAMDEQELISKLQGFDACHQQASITSVASDDLVNCLRSFIFQK